MTNPNRRVLIFSILRFISTKCCKTQIIPIPTPANNPGRILYPDDTFTYSPAKPSLKRTPASTFPAKPREKLGFRTSCPNAVTETIIAITAINKCFIK